MITSKVAICNLALATIGEDAIRDFSEDNTRTRMCDVFYEMTRDYILSQFNWNFARRQQKLLELSDPPDWLAPGMYCYDIPADCHKVLDILPEGSGVTYEVRGSAVYCKLGPDTDVILVYTRHELDPTKYSSGFVNLLSLGIATRLAPTLTQDKSLTNAVFNQYKLETREMWADDAQIGNTYPLSNDVDPNNDSFVREL